MRSLRLVKRLSNWKPKANTYHRDLGFFLSKLFININKGYFTDDIFTKLNIILLSIPV